MPINSKQKGARYERHIASKLREFGYDQARRTAQYCGNTGDASDVVGLPYIHIECKHCEQTRIFDWIAQAVRDSAKSGKLPAVFHTKNYCDDLVTMRLEDWMPLFQAYELNMSEDGK